MTTTGPQIAVLALSHSPQMAQDTRHLQGAGFRRGFAAVARLGNLWGSALAGSTTVDDVAAEARQIINVLDRRGGRDDLGWYAIETARPELLSLIVHVAV